MLEQLKQMASSLNMTDDVISVGFQSNVPEWLASADIFAFPSLKENHSIAVLEAMRAGICIVATNVGGNCESVNDEQEALIVPPADIKALADALEKVIINANLRKRLSVAARERFDKEFTEEAMMRNIIKVLKS